MAVPTGTPTRTPRRATGGASTNLQSGGGPAHATPASKPSPGLSAAQRGDRAQSAMLFEMATTGQPADEGPG